MREGNDNGFGHINVYLDNRIADEKDILDLIDYIKNRNNLINVVIINYKLLKKTNTIAIS